MIILLSHKNKALQFQDNIFHGTNNYLNLIFAKIGQLGNS